MLHFLSFIFICQRTRFESFNSIPNWQKCLLIMMMLVSDAPSLGSGPQLLNVWTKLLKMQNTFNAIINLNPRIIHSPLTERLPFPCYDDYNVIMFLSCCNEPQLSIAMARHLIILKWKYGSFPKFEGLDFGYWPNKLDQITKVTQITMDLLKNFSFILESL